MAAVNGIAIRLQGFGRPSGASVFFPLLAQGSVRLRKLHPVLFSPLPPGAFDLAPQSRGRVSMLGGTA